MMYIPRDVATVVIIALAQVHVTAVRDVVVWIVAESRVKRKYKPQELKIMIRAPAVAG